MNLNQASKENLEVILNEMKDRLGVANHSLFDVEDYDLDKYDDIKFLYDHIVKSGSLSPQETDAFIIELKNVRK